MTDRGDHDFWVRPGAPKNRGKGQGQSFVSKVLKQAGKASGGKSAVRRPTAGGSGQHAGQRPGSRLGRGHTAARFAGAKLTPMSRRVTIKTLLVNQRNASPQSLAKHLRYIERDGAGRNGEPGRAYGPQTDEADLDAFKERCQDDRHHFRFIVSPEDSAELDDLRTYTRHLMNRMEADLGTRLDWVAVDHWNTDNPHTHLIVRGRDDTGKDLIIAGDYIAHGFRHRAAELATEWLGPRTELEIQQTLQREVEQERWTSLDRTLQREAGEDGRVQIERFNEPRLQRQRLLLIGRLQHLQRLGLADEVQPGTWAVHADAEKTLRALGERGDIIRTMQRAMSGKPRELAVFEPGDDGRTIVGRVAAKGLADELHDRGYLVIDGLDGKAHYVALDARDELANYPIGAVVEVRGSAEVRAADKNIATLASNGLYRTDHHLAIEQGRAKPGRDPVTFATNDERTAKRISETLGTATELRAQRNYAGHRLAPWLGHLMVSRQETARPLLTPGEVMQLPPEDAVVMVSSVAPIRAKKLRYYVDANFKDRVLPPPVLAVGRYADAPPARPDDWSGLAIPAVPTAPTSVSADGPGGTDDGGPRRQLELSETVAYEPELDACANDLELLDDDDLALPLPGQLDPAMQRTARLASLDPNDGIDL